jgi:Tfp pilus assembly protein PilF
MKLYSAVVAVLLLGSGVYMAGCSSGVPIMSDQRTVRVDGVEYYNRGDYESALSRFQNAVKQDARDFRSQYYLGLCYEQMNNFQQAVQAYKAALKVMRQTPSGREAIDFRQLVMNQLASDIVRHDQDGLEQKLLEEQGQDTHLETAQRAEAYFLLAKICRYRHDADSALKDYYVASEWDQKDFWLQKEAGLYMYQMGKIHTPVDRLRRAIAMESRDQEVRTAMQALKLDVPQVFPTAEATTPLTVAIPLPRGAELKMADAPTVAPTQLPNS